MITRLEIYELFIKQKLGGMRTVSIRKKKETDKYFLLTSYEKALTSSLSFYYWLWYLSGYKKNSVLNKNRESADLLFHTKRVDPNFSWDDTIAIFDDYDYLIFLLLLLLLLFLIQYLILALNWSQAEKLFII
jgi:hypothetical protein